MNTHPRPIRFQAVVVILSLVVVALTCSATVAPAPVADPGSTPPPPVRLDEPPLVEQPDGTFLRYEEWRDGPLPLWVDDGVEAPTTQPPVAADTQSASLNLVGWSRVVASTINFGTGYYNLVLFDGNSRIPLTNAAGNDLYARLDSHAQNIMFASTRDGDYEIFRMAVNGTGLQQLTFNTSTDNFPDWSPDDTKVLFSSFRDGNYEVYVMNADGSGQTRITNTPTVDEIYPVWSQDGTQIAWIERVQGSPTGEGSIWIANPNGSGATKIAGNLRYPSRLDWRPDSIFSIALPAVPHTYIGGFFFSSDIDYDGWFELTWISSIGQMANSVYQPLASHGYWFDEYFGSWSPSENIDYTYTFYHMEYVSYDSRLYIDYSDIMIADEPARHPASNGYDVLPYWGKTDFTPPSSGFTDLPDYVKAGYPFGSHPVIASDEDSGIYKVERQYSTSPNGPWSVYIPGHTGWLSQIGIPLYWRSQAIDFAGNREPGHTVPDTSTIQYITSRSWQLLDNRFLPVGNLGFDIGGSEAAAQVSPVARLEMFAFLETDYIFNALSQGYAPLPVAYDSRMEYPLTTEFFTPEDTVLRNGLFEESPTEPTDWSLSGELPATVETAPHNNRLKLGASCGIYCPVDAFTLQLPTNTPPRLLIDSQGKKHVFYTSFYTNMYMLFHTELDEHNQIISTTQLSPATNVAGDNYTVAIDSNDTIHLAAIWVLPGDENTMYLQKPSGEAWSSLETLGLPRSNSVQIAIDENDTVTIVATAGCPTTTGCPSYLDIYTIQRSTNGVWSSPFTYSTTLPVQIPNRNYSEFYSLQPILVDSDNRLFIGLMSNEKTSSIYMLTEGARNFTQLRYCPDSVNDYWLSALHFTSDRQIGLYGKCTQFSNLTSQYVFDLDNLDQPPVLVETISAFDTRSLPSEILYTTHGERYIAMDGTSPFPIVTYVDGNEYTLHLSSFRTHLYTRSNYVTDDPVYMIFGPSPKDPVTYPFTWYFEGYSFAAIPQAHVELRQQVTIPMSLNKPTLTWAHEIVYSSPLYDGLFEVTLDNGSTVHVIFSSSASDTGVQSHWADLTPWQGQTVDVIFRLNQQAATLPPEVLLDKVSLGSWWTPLITNLSESQLDVGEAATLTITGENFIDGATVTLNGQAVGFSYVSDTTMTVDIPDNLPLGLHRIVVINPGGQPSPYSAVLIVGIPVFLPVVNR